MDFIESLADCIMQFEGWKQPNQTAFPRGSTSWRNRNPGNLRDSPIKKGMDDKGYAVFETLSNGWDALRLDIKAKFTFPNKHNLLPNSTLTDFFNIYAPALDKNDPQQYSRTIAQWLGKIYNAQVTADSTLEYIMSLK
jgi:hypothetical protein